MRHKRKMVLFVHLFGGEVHMRVTINGFISLYDRSHIHWLNVTSYNRVNNSINNGYSFLFTVPVLIIYWNFSYCLVCGCKICNMRNTMVLTALQNSANIRTEMSESFLFNFDCRKYKINSSSPWQMLMRLLYVR